MSFAVILAIIAVCAAGIVHGMLWELIEITAGKAAGAVFAIAGFVALATGFVSVFLTLMQAGA